MHRKWPRWGSHSLLDQEVKTLSLPLLAQLPRRAGETRARLFRLEQRIPALYTTLEAPPRIQRSLLDSLSVMAFRLFLQS